MSVLDKLLKKKSIRIIDEPSTRKLSELKKVTSLKVSPRGRLSVPKVLFNSLCESACRPSHFLPLIDEETNELMLYLMDEREMLSEESTKNSAKKILFYQSNTGDSPSNPSTAYFEIGPQLRVLKQLDENSKGFMLKFRNEENGKVLVLELNSKF